MVRDTSLTSSSFTNYTCLALDSNGIITCTANNLTQHTIYQIVIVGEATEEGFPMPSAPILVNISGMWTCRIICITMHILYLLYIIDFPLHSTNLEPGKLENLTVTQTEEGFVLTWELPEEFWSLHDNVTIIYSCSCQNETVTVESVSLGNSFLLDSLTPGINYSVEIKAHNVLGHGPITEGTIAQSKVGM